MTQEKCIDCGNEELQFRAWVDRNNNFIEYDPNYDSEAWCTKCEEHVFTEVK